MKIILILTTIILVSCGKSPDSDIEYYMHDYTGSGDLSKPAALMIGDSVSYGYQQVVIAHTPGLQSIHNYSNARSTRNGIVHIDQWLSGRKKWDVITFNHGLWDTGKRFGITVEMYKHNLRIIAKKIQARTDHPIFFTTTFVPANCGNNIPGREVELNVAAIEVMTELGIPVYDLNAVSLSIKHLLKHSAEQNDVHYTNEGYDVLGRFVANAIKAESGF